MERISLKTQHIIIYLVLLISGVLAALKSIPMAINSWYDISKGYISGSWIIVARSGDALWPLFIAIAVMESMLSLGAVVIILFSLVGIFRACIKR